MRKSMVARSQFVSEWQGMHPVETCVPHSEQTVHPGSSHTLRAPLSTEFPSLIFVWFFSFPRQKREELAQRVAEERSRREEEARRLEAEQARERAEQLRRQAEEREQREREEAERLQKQVRSLGAGRHTQGCPLPGGVEVIPDGQRKLDSGSLELL